MADELALLRRRAYGPDSGALTPTERARLAELEDQHRLAHPHAGSPHTASPASRSAPAAPSAVVIGARSRWPVVALGVALLLIGIVAGLTAAPFLPRAGIQASNPSATPDAPISFAERERELSALGPWDTGSLRPMVSIRDDDVWWATRDDGKTTCVLVSWVGEELQMCGPTHVVRENGLVSGSYSYSDDGEWRRGTTLHVNPYTGLFVVGAEP